ncbi:hypothetical protein SKAU_G00176010 [Synaphobranchus kaupii]|uniref:Uncharacterized protein n=1 Tax=Synaphobranchus kaupii TaxID=118154 RepID=A0A9Q1FLI1_SYNKA|nr:hypothetical protein SKAU_G00176010 [Synaphobranchus kaupii]
MRLAIACSLLWDTQPVNCFLRDSRLLWTRSPILKSSAIYKNPQWRYKVDPAKNGNTFGCSIKSSISSTCRRRET